MSGERLRRFMKDHRIGFSASDFYFERIHNMRHVNDWEVLKYIHCLEKYFSMNDMRFFVRSNDEEAKQFVLIFANADLHVNILADEKETKDYIRAYKRYYEHVHLAE